MFRKFCSTLAILLALALPIAGCAQPATTPSVSPSSANVASSSGEPTKEESAKIKNVILMISDGTAVGVSTLARWYGAYDPKSNTFDADYRLNLDEYISGLIRTYGIDPNGMPTAATDSAPGATAFATGYKSYGKNLGIDSGDQPRVTLLELAEALGKSTGLVSTVHTQHATPAVFAAHTPERDDSEGIAAQMLEVEIDVVFGGGSQFLQNRVDGRDLVAELQDKGYGYLSTAEEMKAFEGDRVYGMFAPHFMNYEIDREQLAPEEPSLEEMTIKSLEILSKNEEGFFLMVEGSKVDWGAHNNDPVAVVSEFLAFDQAVKVAMDYAKGRTDTLVLVVEDHSTGGISISDAGMDKGYEYFMVEQAIRPLASAKVTGHGAVELLSRGESPERVLELLGISDPTAEELALLREMVPDPGLARSANRAALGKLVSARSYIGWTTVGHTGEDVVLYSYLPSNERMVGLYENTAIFKAIVDAWGVPVSDTMCPHQK